MGFFDFFSPSLCAWRRREGVFRVVFRGLLRVNGGLFGVIEGFFRVIWTFFGCFCERVCRLCALREVVVINEVRVNFVVYE